MEPEHMPDREDRMCEHVECMCWNHAPVRMDDDNYIRDNKQEEHQAPEELECGAAEVYEYDVVKNRVQSGINGYEGQQIDSSSVATADLQHESNTNTEPGQEAEIVAASTQLVKISDINVGKRFRKDLGSTDDLEERIRGNRLLYPVIVRKDNLLVDGARRMEAYKKLNIQDIPVIVKDVPIKEDAEIDANLVKDFTIEEKVAIKRYRESTEPNLQGQRNDLKLPGKIPRSDNKQRREERIAESTRVSYKTLRKMEEIVDAAQKNPEKFGDMPKKINSEQMSVSKASKIIQRENIRQEILEKAHAEASYNNYSDNLICGDFRDVCRKHISDNSINLIFTDPPYSRQHLQLYQSLGIEAFRMLKEGGSLVMYAPHYALPEIFDYMKNSGLKYRWQIVVRHTGSFARMFSNTVIVTYKPLLWYFKGSGPKILEFIEDSVESKPPDKSLHPWAQSTVEAEYVISKLTIPNDVVLDCTMGTGTTGIAALKLKRRFVGIELNEDTLAIARHKISQIISSTQRLQGETIN
jgi:DNA modification methylase